MYLHAREGVNPRLEGEEERCEQGRIEEAREQQTELRMGAGLAGRSEEARETCI